MNNERRDLESLHETTNQIDWKTIQNLSDAEILRIFATSRSLTPQMLDPTIVEREDQQKLHEKLNQFKKSLSSGLLNNELLEPELFMQVFASNEFLKLALKLSLGSSFEGKEEHLKQLISKYIISQGDLVKSVLWTYCKSELETALKTLLDSQNNNALSKIYQDILQLETNKPLNSPNALSPKPNENGNLPPHLEDNLDKAMRERGWGSLPDFTTMNEAKLEEWLSILGDNIYQLIGSFLFLGNRQAPHYADLNSRLALQGPTKPISLEQILFTNDQDPTNHGRNLEVFLDALNQAVITKNSALKACYEKFNSETIGLISNMFRLHNIAEAIMRKRSPTDDASILHQLEEAKNLAINANPDLTVFMRKREFVPAKLTSSMRWLWRVMSNVLNKSQSDWHPNLNLPQDSLSNIRKNIVVYYGNISDYAMVPNFFIEELIKRFGLNQTEAKLVWTTGYNFFLANLGQYVVDNVNKSHVSADVGYKPWFSEGYAKKKEKTADAPPLNTQVPSLGYPLGYSARVGNTQNDFLTLLLDPTYNFDELDDETAEIDYARMKEGMDLFYYNVYKPLFNPDPAKQDKNKPLFEQPPLLRTKKNTPAATIREAQQIIRDVLNAHDGITSNIFNRVIKNLWELLPLPQLRQEDLIHLFEPPSAMIKQYENQISRWVFDTHTYGVNYLSEQYLPETMSLKQMKTISTNFYEQNITEPNLKTKILNELHSCNDSSSVKNLFRGVFLLEIVPRMMLWNFQLHKRNKNALIEQSIVKLLKNELSSEEHDHLSINRGGQPPHHESMIVLCHALTALMLTILNEGGAPYNLVVLQDKDLFRHILDLMNEMIYSGELSFIQHGDGLIETKVPPDSTAYTLDSVALYTLIIQSKF